jgi:SAM-dependent methyltransferase
MGGTRHPAAASKRASEQTLMRTTGPAASPNSKRPARIAISFPHAEAGLDQDEEWFIAEIDGRRRRLRIHDYDELYRVPGLYEALVYDTLECTSPRRISDLLESVLADWPLSPAGLRVLDLGAGNGCVAEVLRGLKVPHIVGLDLIPEACDAARRDRADVYDDYLVADLCDLTPVQNETLRGHRLNCLITVAALGYGDVPPLAFGTAFNLIRSPGWLAMTIKEDFLDPDDQSGFARLMRRMIDEGVVAIQAHHRYCHRRSINGEQLFYVAVVARKDRDVPRSWLDDTADVGSEIGHEPDHASLLLGR